eukprot:984973-Amphidinium_carterae.1
MEDQIRKAYLRKAKQVAIIETYMEARGRHVDIVTCHTDKQHTGKSPLLVLCFNLTPHCQLYV